MFPFVVKLFGFPKAIFAQREIALDLPEGARLSDVVAQLREKLPGLEGFAIAPGENRLIKNFKFNLNGQLIYTAMDVEIKTGDRLALLIPASGG